MSSRNSYISEEDIQMVKRNMKKFNITNQENMNPNYNEISPHSNKLVIIEKTPSACMDMEKKQPLHTVGGNVNVN